MNSLGILLAVPFLALLGTGRSLAAPAWDAPPVQQKTGQFWRYHWYQRGLNRIELLSDTEHHGIEIIYPGPALMVRYRSPDR